jgi:hypothetical protein
MKNFKLIFAIALLAASAAFGQTALTQTTLSAAITINQTAFAVGSTTNISGCTVTHPCPIFVMDPGSYRGELMQVTAVPSSGNIVVQRGGSGTGGPRTAHVSGAIVLIASSTSYAQSFPLYDPTGGCTVSPTSTTVNNGTQTDQFTPWVNVNNGNQWLCSSVTSSWVPGWGNSYLDGSLAPTATVASTAGQITPSGPLFIISGTAAITGFNLPIGFNGGRFCVIPTGAFTTTTANNIAIASTAVVGQLDCWTYDISTAKWYPNY